MNIKKGNPLQKGSTKQKDGYNFAIASAAEIIDLLLYAPKADEPEYRIELTEAYKTGDVFSVHISGIYWTGICIAMRRTGGKSLIRMQRRLQAVKFLAKMKTGSI